MARVWKIRAKSDSFFIRATIPTNGTTYAQDSVALGAYVDALGKSVLRIHNIAVQYGSPLDTYAGAANTSTSSCFQLTTQSQTAMVNASDKSVIASGRLAIATGAAEVSMMSENLDVAPQHWTKGYLVGVEQIFLGVAQSFNHINRVTIVLECTVETLSQSAAMALALSQQ